MQEIVIIIATKFFHVALLERLDGAPTFPSGKVEPGESPEQAARRELLEETGLVAGRCHPLATVSDAIAGLVKHYFFAPEPEGELSNREPKKHNQALYAHIDGGLRGIRLSDEVMCFLNRKLDDLLADRDCIVFGPPRSKDSYSPLPFIHCDIPRLVTRQEARFLKYG
jgi:8-oxo-dGTP pyrophosphatase MutT (NUDIX family)